MTTHGPAGDTTLNPKASYVGAPAVFALELAIRPVLDSFAAVGCYVVGSALERSDWRDVDVRLMMTDEAFAREFPDARDGIHELDTRWLVLTTAISQMLQQQTGLPIDFQIQPMTRTNARHTGARHSIGQVLPKRTEGGDGGQSLKTTPRVAST